MASACLKNGFAAALSRFSLIRKGLGMKRREGLIGSLRKGGTIKTLCFAACL
jgi:hypothetical protein